MNIVVDTIEEIKRLKALEFIFQLLQFGMIVASALMIWKTCIIVSHCDSPIVVVLR